MAVSYGSVNTVKVQRSLCLYTGFPKRTMRLEARNSPIIPLSQDQASLLPGGCLHGLILSAAVS